MKTQLKNTIMRIGMLVFLVSMSVISADEVQIQPGGYNSYSIRSASANLFVTINPPGTTTRNYGTSAVKYTFKAWDTVKLSGKSWTVKLDGITVASGSGTMTRDYSNPDEVWYKYEFTYTTSASLSVASHSIYGTYYGKTSSTATLQVLANPPPPPSTPANFQVSEPICYDGMVQFTWTTNPDVTGYKLYEANLGGPYSLIQTLTQYYNSYANVIRVDSVDITRTYHLTSYKGIYESSPTAPLSVAWVIRDFDQDGLNDSIETIIYQSDPFNNDTDDDGLLDGDEIFIYDTDPINPDSDEDGLFDKEEIFLGIDGYLSDPNSDDSDNDQLSDYYESQVCDTDPSDTTEPFGSHFELDSIGTLPSGWALGEGDENLVTVVNSPDWSDVGGKLVQIEGVSASYSNNIRSMQKQIALPTEGSVIISFKMAIDTLNSAAENNRACFDLYIHNRRVFSVLFDDGNLELYNYATFNPSTFRMPYEEKAWYYFDLLIDFDTSNIPMTVYVNSSLIDQEFNLYHDEFPYFLEFSAWGCSNILDQLYYVYVDDVKYGAAELVTQTILPQGLYTQFFTRIYAPPGIGSKQVIKVESEDTVDWGIKANVEYKYQFGSPIVDNHLVIGGEVEFHQTGTTESSKSRSATSATGDIILVQTWDGKITITGYKIAGVNKVNILTKITRVMTYPDQEPGLNGYTIEQYIRDFLPGVPNPLDYVPDPAKYLPHPTPTYFHYPGYNAPDYSDEKKSSLKREIGGALFGELKFGRWTIRLTANLKFGKENRVIAQFEILDPLELEFYYYSFELDNYEYGVNHCYKFLNARYI